MAQRLDVRYVAFHTDGTAARKVAEVKPFTTLKLPKLKKQQKLVLRIDPVAVAGILMSAVMVIMLTVGFVQLHNAREEAAVMDAYVQLLQEENERLTEKYQKDCNLENVRITAMALGLVPIEQVRHVSVPVTPVEAPEEPGPFEQLFTFLTGLFA